MLYTSNITQSIVKVYEMEQILGLATLEAEQKKLKPEMRAELESSKKRITEYQERV